MKPSLLALLLGLASTLGACGGGDAPEPGGSAAGAGGSMSGSGGSISDSGATGGQAGTMGSAGSGGVAGSASGTGGSDPSPDASGSGGSATDAGSPAPDSAAPDDGSASASYVCSLILGILTTSEWFGGFEKVVDNARWEIKFQDSAHLEEWADPAHAVWSLPITSPCARNADAPDRIVFMGTNYDYDTVDLFLPKYIAVLNNIKAKYPSVKRLDVMTYTRAPGNKECIGADRSSYSYIKPAQDEAMAQFAAMNPGFVFVAPKWEVQSCDDFTLCPHLTGPANGVISKTIGSYFLSH